MSEKEKKGAKTEVIVREGELLTMTSAEAKELGFADAVVVDRAELLDFYDLGEAKVVEMIPTWSEELARLIQRYGIIFLGLGLLGIYLEIKTPGFGVPGILGISCLVIFFLGKYVVGLAEEVDILLFVIGIALLALEIFVIPGFGVAGILGILFIVAGIYLASLPFWIPRELPDFQRQLLHTVQKHNNIHFAYTFLGLPEFLTDVQGRFHQISLQNPPDKLFTHPDSTYVT